MKINTVARTKLGIYKELGRFRFFEDINRIVEKKRMSIYLIKSSNGNEYIITSPVKIIERFGNAT